MNPNKYTITAEYKLTKVSNNLVVKQTLKLVKKTVKAKKGKKLALRLNSNGPTAKQSKAKRLSSNSRAKNTLLKQTVRVLLK